MQREEEITVGIPLYNGETDVERAIESVLNQTFTNFKVFISDNASTDDSIEICKRFEQVDRRIHIHHHQENIGVIQNFYLCGN